MVARLSQWRNAAFSPPLPSLPMAATGAVAFLLALLALFRFGATASGLVATVNAWLLLACAVYDFRQRRIPTRLALIALALALAGAWLQGMQALALSGLGGCVGYMMFWVIAKARPGAMGWGDVRLAGLIGLMVGLQNVVLALALGMGMGGLAALALLLGAGVGRHQAMVYGPYLIAGAWLAMFWP